MKVSEQQSVYERQHHIHREAEKFKQLAADPELSPGAAELARKLARRAKAARALIDKHVVHLHYPESPEHQERLHALLAQLRRDGNDSPGHVEKMLTHTTSLAREIDETKREFSLHQLLRVELPPRLMQRIRSLFTEPGRRAR
jgi:hypothetical protein